MDCEAAGSGVNRDDSVERIGLAVEHGAGFKLFVNSGQSLDVALEIGEHVFAFASELNIGLDIAGAVHQFLVVGDHDFQALFVAHERFGGVWIRPEGRIGQLGFYFG